MTDTTLSPVGCSQKKKRKKKNQPEPNLSFIYPTSTFIGFWSTMVHEDDKACFQNRVIHKIRCVYIQSKV